MLKSNASAGFTLIELLVTVAIVAILASTAVAVYEEYRVAAFNSEALSAQNLLRTAAEVLQGDLLESECPSSPCTTICSNESGSFSCSGTLVDKATALIPAAVRNNPNLKFVMSVSDKWGPSNDIPILVDTYHCKGDKYFSSSVYGSEGNLSFYDSKKTDFAAPWGNCP